MTEVATPPSGDDEQFPGSGLTVNIYGADLASSSSVKEEISWAMRTAMAPGIRARYWETPEYREKYDDKAREALAKKGIGYALPDGSFPTDDASDVEKAVHAVGRGGADHDHIRVHIMAAAKRLGCMDLIPADWRPDGSIKAPEQKSRQPRRKSRQRAIPLAHEVRFYNSTLAEFREDESTGLVTITGTPIVYNTPYTVTDFLGEFTERMNDSVGADVVARGFDVRLLENHKGLPYARTKPGNGQPPTLVLEHEPGVGLRMKATVDPDAPRVQDLLSALSRGDVSEMSVGFMVAQDQWNEDYTDREIFRFAELLDVSIVTFPASPTTSVELGRGRRVLMDVRAGKVLSDENLAHTKAAHLATGALLKAAGIDPATLTDDGEPDEPESVADGSDGGTTGSGVAPDSVNQDGSGVFRGENDPGEKIREMLAMFARSAPTPEDYSITSSLKWLKSDLATIKALQLHDPDLASDPDDQAVMDALSAIDAEIDKAIVAQSKDAHADADGSGQRDASRAREIRERTATAPVAIEARKLLA